MDTAKLTSGKKLTRVRKYSQSRFLELGLQRHLDAARILLRNNAICDSPLLAVPPVGSVNRVLAASVLYYETEESMDSNYVFLCGVMWCRYGQEDARSELMRAAECKDADLSALALALLREGYRSLRKWNRLPGTSFRASAGAVLT